jgi:hypothetical protein
MRWRLLRRCLLFTLLGLVTAVAVAWGFTMYSRLRQLDTAHAGVGIAVVDNMTARVIIFREPGLYTEQWRLTDITIGGPEGEARRNMAKHLQEVGGFTYDYGSSARMEDHVPRADHLAAQGPPQPVTGIGREQSLIEWVWAGWPLRAMRCSSRTDYGSMSPLRIAGTSERNMLRVSARFAPAGSHARYSGGMIALPLEPRPGLLLNTILYALLWAILLLAPGALRRRIRRGRGRCPKCGYFLRGQPAPGCPECGLGREGVAG